MPTQRIGAENSATRARLLDAAEKLMSEEGYAAVTKRNVARTAGLKPQLVYYYFRTMDNLFLALHQRVVERTLKRMEKALTTKNPVRDLWKIMSDRSAAALEIEFRALANHRKIFRKHMAQAWVLFRKIQIRHLTRYLEERGVGSQAEADPLADFVTNLSAIVCSEKLMGISMGHTQTMAFVERCFQLVEAAIRSRKPLSNLFRQLPSTKQPKVRVEKIARNPTDVTTQRIGEEGSAIRVLLLEGAGKLMVEEGYAAVTTRRLARRVGLKPQVVHYYYGTMDALLLAMYRRLIDQTVKRIEEAMITETPVRALWDFASDPAGMTTAVELWALANHRKAFRKLLAQSRVRFRKVLVNYLTRFFKGRVPDPQALSLLVAVLAGGISRPLVAEKAIGISKEHSGTLALVDACIRHLDETGRPIDPLFWKDSGRKRRP
jgi:AcrR family transcriptional regulator